MPPGSRRAAFVFGALLLAWTHGAAACSCMGIDNAGFVHTAAKRLPANARGALFLPPKGTFRIIGNAGQQHYLYAGAMEKLAAAAFKINSDRVQGSVKGELSWPELQSSGSERYYRYARQRDEAGATKVRAADIAALLKRGVLIDGTAEVSQARRLLRVGPVGGFKAGARYTVRYLGKAENWRFPAQVAHAIDAVALPTRGGKFALVVDGPPLAMLLQQSTSAGSCSSNEPALVQHFHFALPPAYAAYTDAVIFSSERRSAAGEPFVSNYYVPSLCPTESFQGGAFGAGKDMIYADCKARTAPVTVRGWTGLLEVEDRLHATGSVELDLGPAAGGSCTGAGILAQALAGGDAARIKQSVCAIGRRWSQDPKAPEVFPATAFFSLFAANDPELQACARLAARRLYDETEVLDGANLARYSASIKADLSSDDRARIAWTSEQMGQLGRLGGAKREALLVTVVDEMVLALIANRAPETSELVTAVGRFKDRASRHVPALLSVAASESPGTVNAMLVLEELIGDEARLLSILIGNAQRPALREQAALAYSRLAGKKQPDQAIALLIEAARHGSEESVSYLARYGSRASAAIPLLRELARTGRDVEMRYAAISALLSLSSSDVQSIAVIANALNAPGADRISDYAFADLPKLGAAGKALLPAFELRMRQPLSRALKDYLVQAVTTMRLPEAQRADLVGRLEQAVRE